MAETQLATPRKAHATLETMLSSDKVKAGFAAVATQYMPADKMVRMCVNALRRTPKLGQCDPATVLGAMMTAQSLGLEPNTVLGHAHLIPYGRKVKQNGQWIEIIECQFQLGYKGLVALMKRNPNVVDIFAECVHQNDIFEYEQGSTTMARFKKALVDRGDPIAAFAYMKYRRGEFEGESLYVLPLEEIHKIRAQSDTWRTLKQYAEASDAKDYQKRKFADTPWEKWFDEMAAKSAIKRLAKQQDLAPAVAIAAAIDDASESGRADFGKMSDPAFARDVIEGVGVPVSEDEDENPPQVEPPKTKPATAKPAEKAKPAAQKKATTIDLNEKLENGLPRYAVGDDGGVFDQEMRQPVDLQMVRPDELAKFRKHTPHDPETGEIQEPEPEPETKPAAAAADDAPPADPDDDSLFGNDD